jgi:hypothetical protein
LSEGLKAGAMARLEPSCGLPGFSLMIVWRFSCDDMVRLLR